MDTWAILFWGCCAALAAGALYALHRIALRLEANGHLYYLNKKPSGGVGGCFVALQRAIEPQIEHVIHVSAESRLHGEAGGSSQGDTDLADAPLTDPDDSSQESRIGRSSALNMDRAPPIDAPSARAEH